MTPWEEMVTYVGFSEADGDRLRALAPIAEPELPAIVDRFYAAILRTPGARRVLEDDAQVERLKRTLIRWIQELLAGPWDLDYWRRRQRIGRVHVRVGLPERYVFTAMNLIRHDLVDLAFAHLSHDDARATCASLGRITDLELAVMSGTYLEAHEDQELRVLQDLIIRNMPVTLICLDESGRVTAATRPSRFLGEGSGEGRHYQAFLDPELVEAVDLPTLLGRALATGREVVVPRTTVGAGASARQLRVSVVPLEHELVRAMVHLEDLTDALHAEARLQQAEALARIGGLAASVAHEIRNPLTAISTTLQVIGGSMPEGDPRRQILVKVDDQVRRLDRLVTDLLRYARPPRPEIAPIDLAEVAQGALVGAVGQVDLSVGEAGLAAADPQMVQQILLNLLRNAREAAGAAGRVRLRVGPGAVVVVEDDGPGVPPEVRETLFEPFVTTRAKGTGLGLAISRKLAESMAGSLALEPSSGGARFRLKLPAA